MSYLAKTPEDLLPCPFCGGNATSYGTRKMASGGSTHCLVHCDECSARLSAETENDAVEAWNRRAERTCDGNRDELEDAAHRLADLIEPSCDRDALLALADELCDGYPYGLSHGGLEQLARRIREALGVES